MVLVVLVDHNKKFGLKMVPLKTFNSVSLLVTVTVGEKCLILNQKIMCEL